MATANCPSLNLHVTRSSAVAVQRVPAAAVDAFLEWQRGASRAASSFAGYCGTDVFPPAPGQGDEWVVLIRFEDEVSLTRWLDSPERARRVEELRARVGNFDLKTLDGGFGPWFAQQDRPRDAAPASWKMALTVLLALFPTVMLLTILVGPLTSPLGTAFSMLVGNAMSISVLQWLVMPRLTKWLDPWLRGGEPSWRATPIIIFLTLTILTAFFHVITG
jgi:antibiotic biosynthesis monooxygenase (ABM) superfamily enzyme